MVPPTPPHHRPVPHTCEFADSSIGSHIVQYHNAMVRVTGSCVHLNECMGANSPVGIVSDVDGVAARTLQEAGEQMKGQEAPHK